MSPQPLPRVTEVLGWTWCRVSTGCKTSSPGQCQPGRREDPRRFCELFMRIFMWVCVSVCARTCTPSPAAGPAAIPGIRSRSGQAPGRGSCLSPAPPAPCPDPPAGKQGRQGPGAAAGRGQGPGRPWAPPGQGTRGQSTGYARSDRALRRGGGSIYRTRTRPGDPARGIPAARYAGHSAGGQRTRTSAPPAIPAPFPGCGRGKVVPPPASLYRSAPTPAGSPDAPARPEHPEPTAPAPLRCSHQVHPAPGHPPPPKATPILPRNPAASAATRTPGHPTP